MLIAEMEVSMTVDARHSPNREDFIRGSDMVSLMQGKWNELYKIKMGQIGRKDLSHLFNVNLGTFTESLNMDWAKQNYDYKFAIKQKYIEPSLKLPHHYNRDFFIYNHTKDIYNNTVTKEQLFEGSQKRFIYWVKTIQV